jgi:hypothetical protein
MISGIHGSDGPAMFPAAPNLKQQASESLVVDRRTHRDNHLELSDLTCDLT